MLFFWFAPDSELRWHDWAFWPPPVGLIPLVSVHQFGLLTLLRSMLSVCLDTVWGDAILFQWTHFWSAWLSLHFFFISSRAFGLATFKRVKMCWRDLVGFQTKSNFVFARLSHLSQLIIVTHSSIRFVSRWSCSGRRGDMMQYWSHQ